MTKLILPKVAPNTNKFLRDEIYDILKASGMKVKRATVYALAISSWIQSNIKLVDLQWAGSNIVLAPFQQDFIDNVFGTLNRKGERKYTEALFCLPRKHAKTTLIAAICLYFLIAEPLPGQQIINVAINLEQAKIVLNIGKRMVHANPMLDKMCRCLGNSIIVPENDSSWKAMPAVAGDIQGAHPRVAICDEVHTYKDFDVINALRSGQGGHKEPLVIYITTVSQNRKGPLWELLHGEARKDGTFGPSMYDDPNAYVQWIGAKDSDDATDKKVWRAASPASWITDEYLESEYRKLSLPFFEQYHLNRFPTRSIGKAFSTDDWKACQATPVIDKKARSVIGVDASQTRDHTAVFLDQFDGEFHNILVWVWKPSDFELEHIDTDVIRDHIKMLYREYNVQRIVADGAYFNEALYQLNADGFPAEKFKQSDEMMVPACDYFVDCVVKAKIRAGKDATIKEHVLNVATKQSKSGGYRFTKDTDKEKIDAAIAGTMAMWIAREDYNSKGVTFAEQGGLRSLKM